MEKVCVYSDTQNITKAITWYKYVAVKLQELADLFIEADIVPTIGKLQNLYNGSSLCGLIDESCENQGVNNKMPRLVRELTRKDATQKVDSIKEKAAKEIITDSWGIEWEFYQVNNGKVEIRSDYKEILTDRFSIYIDTESRKAVYDKWLILEKALKDFNQAVADAPKESTFYDNMVKINNPFAEKYNPQYMGGLSLPDHFALARLEPDGTAVLKGENFGHIK